MSVSHMGGDHAGLLKQKSAYVAISSPLLSFPLFNLLLSWLIITFIKEIIIFNVTVMTQTSFNLYLHAFTPESFLKKG